LTINACYELYHALMLGALPIIIIFLSSKEGVVAEKDDGCDTQHSNGIGKQNVSRQAAASAG